MNFYFKDLIYSFKFYAKKCSNSITFNEFKENFAEWAMIFAKSKINFQTKIFFLIKKYFSDKS